MLYVCCTARRKRVGAPESWVRVGARVLALPLPMPISLAFAWHSANCQSSCIFTALERALCEGGLLSASRKRRSLCLLCSPAAFVLPQRDLPSALRELLAPLAP